MLENRYYKYFQYIYLISIICIWLLKYAINDIFSLNPILITSSVFFLLGYILTFIAIQICTARQLAIIGDAEMHYHNNEAMYRLINLTSGCMSISLRIIGLSYISDCESDKCTADNYLYSKEANTLSLFCLFFPLILQMFSKCTNIFLVAGNWFIIVGKLFIFHF